MANPFPLLSSIRSPQDLQRLTLSQLEELADEIRQRIMEVLSQTGGHLASNLGIVELTIALHRVFDSPRDKFIWDVSHQTYVHKMLTGRNELLPTIRQFQGLCGFSNPDESIHDHFHAGHAGTALSLSLGVLEARDLNGGEEYVIPIIGDATLTCGMSLEALNNMSRDLKRFIVVLNDNEMSISKNVGAITRILSRLVSNPTIHQLHQDLDTLVSKIPSFGAAISKQVHKGVESVKNLFSSSAFFEQYGLSYIGPIDGHNLPELINVLQRIRTSQWPVILHIQTKKGQGMEQALQNPVSYHGAKPFSVDTGKFHPSPNPAPTFPKIFGQTLLEMGQEDPSIVAVTPAMSAGSCLDAFMKEFPERCFDVGIAESHSVTFAGGMGFARHMPPEKRKKVFASIYSTFLQRALDNVFHDVCLQEIPVVFAIDRAGVAGGDGITHNGIYDLSFLRTMPNMIISQPRNGQLLVDLMHSCFSWGKPACIRYPNLPTKRPDRAPQLRSPGRGELLSPGKDLLIIALGHMNDIALEVRKLAKEQGISVAVFDPIFLKPLDEEALSSLFGQCTRVVTLEEHSLIGGLGSAINDFAIQRGIRHLDILNLGIPEIFVEHGSHSALLRSLALTGPQIYQRVCSHFSLRPEESELPVGV